MSVPNGPFALSIATDSSGQAALNWHDSANNETGFTVERQADDGQFEAIANLPANTTNFTDSGLQAGVQYNYAVCAYSAGGNSSTTYAGPVSLNGSAAVAATVPNAPYVIGLTSPTANEVDLTWHDSHSNETGYEVDRVNPDGSTSVVAKLDANAMSFSDTTAAAATQYAYRIYAYNSLGPSSVLNGSITTAGAVVNSPDPIPAPTPTSTPTPSPVTQSVPDGPFDLTATTPSPTQVSLTWADVHSNETGYKVARVSGNGAVTVVASLDASATSYTDSSAAPSTQYSYNVYAYNDKGPSGAAKATVTTPGVGGVSSSGGGSGDSSSPAGFFPVGVFYQPTYSFTKWASRGVNMLFGYEKGDGATMAQWDAAASAAGFKEIRQPSANPASDANVTNLMAWLAPQDEPDLSNVPASTLASQYASLKAADPNIPVMTNYAGGAMLGMQGSTSVATYQQYLANTDWDASDIYPVTGWGLPNRLGLVGQAVDKLYAYAPNKPAYAFIETSNQQLSWVPNDRGVTPDEMRAEIWDSVIHGAAGIVYFPQQIGNGFQFDVTPANVVAEMTTQDAKLQAFGAALTSATNPSSVGMTTSGPLEVTWRQYGGHTYFFVLNLSANTVTGQAMTLKGINPNSTLSVDGENRSVTVNGTQITDSFSPYALHIYVA